jgi:hypothetical protein
MSTSALHCALPYDFPYLAISHILSMFSALTVAVQDQNKVHILEAREIVCIAVGQVEYTLLVPPSEYELKVYRRKFRIS